MVEKEKLKFVKMAECNLKFRDKPNGDLKYVKVSIPVKILIEWHCRGLKDKNKVEVFMNVADKSMLVKPVLEEDEEKWL